MGAMQVNLFPPPTSFRGLGPVASAPAELDALQQVENYARQSRPALPAPAALSLPVSQPTLVWGDLGPVLATAATDVPENSRRGQEAVLFDDQTRREITGLQHRQAEVEGTPGMCRPVHRQQLFGSGVEVHWNPDLKKRFQFFREDRQQGLIRFSDASNEPGPDGASMFGMALELYGTDGQATDILLTGGSPLTEVSQARDAESQLALFNMINHPNKLVGLGRIASEVGPLSGVKMLMDVKRMRTELDSLASLTAWSRAPFALQGKDGKEYLVKLRAVPEGDATPLSSRGATSSERQASEMEQRASQKDTRWRLELQFMQTGDDPYDARESWSGPWVTAGEIVIPRQSDSAEARRQADLAEQTRFSVWKNKEPHSQAADREVLRPWGELNRARLAAYRTAGANRNCPYLQAQSKTP